MCPGFSRLYDRYCRQSPCNNYRVVRQGAGNHTYQRRVPASTGLVPTSQQTTGSDCASPCLRLSFLHDSGGNQTQHIIVFAAKDQVTVYRALRINWQDHPEFPFMWSKLQAGGPSVGVGALFALGLLFLPDSFQKCF